MSFLRQGFADELLKVARLVRSSGGQEYFRSAASSPSNPWTRVRAAGRIRVRRLNSPQTQPARRRQKQAPATTSPGAVQRGHAHQGGLAVLGRVLADRARSTGSMNTGGLKPYKPKPPSSRGVLGPFPSTKPQSTGRRVDFPVLPKNDASWNRAPARNLPATWAPAGQNMSTPGPNMSLPKPKPKPKPKPNMSLPKAT